MMQHDSEQNKVEILTLSSQQAKYQADSNDMKQQHDDKLRELEDIRLRSNEQIKKMSSEMSAVRSELNVLVMES